MLEVAIGVIFVFILVSIICTAIREGIESWLKTRAAYLEHAIRQLLSDNKGEGLAKDIYTHPLIFGLFNKDYTPGSAAGTPALFAKGNNLPSYIPSRNFALALMDVAARGPMKEDFTAEDSTPIVTLKHLRDNVSSLGNPFVQRLLINAIDAAQGDINRAQANIEDWYNSGMDRVSGWYKRSTQIIIFSLALIISIGLNINTIKIATYLSTNQTARDLLVKNAETLNKEGKLPEDRSYKATVSQLDGLGLPIGWPDNVKFNIKDLPSIFFANILGWLLTALAASLGAPFWFDTLNKVMVIRSTVKPHEKSQEEASEDRQLPASNVAVAKPGAAVAQAVQPAAVAPVVNVVAVDPQVAVQPEQPAAETENVLQPAAEPQAETQPEQAAAESELAVEPPVEAQPEQPAVESEPAVEPQAEAQPEQPIAESEPAVEPQVEVQPEQPVAESEPAVEPQTEAQPEQLVAETENVSQPEDDDSHIDGCDVETAEEDKTNDEDLPLTQGGVA